MNFTFLIFLVVTTDIVDSKVHLSLLRVGVGRGGLRGRVFI